MNIIFSHRHGQEDISGKVRRQTLEDDNVDSALYASLQNAKKKMSRRENDWETNLMAIFTSPCSNHDGLLLVLT